jgi:hypothetical protein
VQSGGSGATSYQILADDDVADQGWAAASNCTGGSVNGTSVSSFQVNVRCSTTSASNIMDIGTPVATVGRYCWCNLKTINGEAVAASKFVYAYDISYGALFCAQNCHVYCSSQIIATSAGIAALFSTLGS